MAELTNLETKLAEVIGLAMAAQDATEKIQKLVAEEGDDDLVKTLQSMAEEAAQAEQRSTEVVEQLEGKKTAILEEARSTKQKASQMMSTYLDSDADALDGLEFLTMAEAGEVGHWSVLDRLSEKAGDQRVRELVEWQLPIQKRHLQTVMEGSVKLASEEDPNETE